MVNFKWLVSCFLISKATCIRWSQFKKLKLNIWTRQATTIAPPVGSTGFKTTRETLNVRIEDTWFDLTNWRKAHPSGEHWIDMYNKRDATEVMQAFHSDTALAMLKRLPKSKSGDQLDREVPEVTQITKNFRALRQQLLKDGWWQRDYLHEFKLLAIWLSLFVSGLGCAKTIPLLSLLLLGFANTSAGWLGHDYIHGVDKFSTTLRNFAALTAGMSPTWWSDKHNKHHAVPNEVGVDEDIATEPVLYVYPPEAKKDQPLRKYQHIYLPFAFSLLFLIWRFDSAKLCLRDALGGFKRKTQWESLLQIIHYTAMGILVPFPVFLGSMLFAGLMSAIIVTVTHQSEDLFWEYNHDFVVSQFQSTRNAECHSPFSQWLWGGMQWQLEHHLFPSMPRSKYPALSKIIQRFALDNNIEYRVSGEFSLIKKNWDMYSKIAAAPVADISTSNI